MEWGKKLMDGFVINFFNWCVEILVNIGDFTGWGYELANIIIFVFLQPTLILLFFCLWIRAILKNGRKFNIQKNTKSHTS
jgi:hypothetical protein